MKRRLLLWMVRYLVERELVIAREVIGFSVEFDPQEHLHLENGCVEITWRMSFPARERNRDLARAYALGDPARLLSIQDRFNLPELQESSRDDYDLYQEFLQELEQWEEMVIREGLAELSRVKNSIRTVAEGLGYRVIRIAPEFPELQRRSGPSTPSVILHPAAQER